MVLAETIDFKNFPDSIVRIQPYAFQSCQSLTSFFIPANVSVVCPGAFAHCFNMVSIDVDKNNAIYQSINGILFDKKGSIVEFPCGKSDTSYTIPDNITFISNFAFMGCGNLTSITIPSSVTTIGGHSFSATSITSIRIPSSVTSFLSGLFSACTSLKTAVIEARVKKIPDRTFETCSSLTSVVIPPSVTSIENNAFDTCRSLESLTIPANVTSIGDEAFVKCYNLKTVTFLGLEAPQCSASAFDSCDKMESVCVPSAYNSEAFCSMNVSGCEQPGPSQSGASRVFNSLFFIAMNAMVILIGIMLA